MAIIRKFLAKDNFTKADNKVAKNRDISDAAKVLYWYMASHKNAFQLNDAYIEVGLGWSRQKIHRCKTQLKKHGLIHIHKIDRTTYFLYIGSSELTAHQVMANWDALEKL